MGTVLVGLSFLVLFLIAPIKVTAIVCGSLLLCALVVQATTTTLSRVNVTLSDSFKAIIYSFFFSIIAFFTIFSFLIGGPREIFMNPASARAAAIPLILLQQGAYILGFKLALGLTLIHAFIVAVASSFITSGAFWFILTMANLSN
ncbi:hypothetical protein [Aquabacterium sp.]|uniref:hypothetical protein n=1 Tax=Aquabacterium sp. TaxID=1872578 RepID=UPI002E37E928|nr:hypothetical protein [Aquabacterium sp.]HEX5310792.1 hypothetical protein [Aquabacterium sp.]